MVTRFGHCWKRPLDEKELILLTFAVASGSPLDRAGYCLRRLSSLESFVPPGRHPNSAMATEDRLNVGIALAACVLSDFLSEQKVVAFEKHVCLKVYENWLEMKAAVAKGVVDGTFYAAVFPVMANPELEGIELLMDRSV